MRPLIGSFALLLLLPLSAPVQGLLERIRHGNSSPSLDLSNKSLNDSSVSGQDDGLNDQGILELAFAGLLGVTSPFWLPPLIVNDSYDQIGSFSTYPYARMDTGFIAVNGQGYDPATTYGDPDYLKPWSVQAQIENGNDFNGLDRIGMRVALDTAWRIGLRTNWDYFQESLSNGRSDSTVLGDSELTWRFAQSDWIRMYAGVGYQTMQDSRTDRWGFNGTYGADIFPVWPLVISASFDVGDLGDVFAFQIRGTAGWAWRNGELFIGYDYRRIGEVNLQGLLGGLRLWF